MKDHTVISNFLPDKDFKELTQQVVWNKDFPMYLNDWVSHENRNNPNLWDWFGCHIVFVEDGFYKDQSGKFPYFLNLFQPLLKWKKLIRIKINFYCRTEKIQKHAFHVDYKYKHKVALLGLNTCDGFTGLKEKKIQSVANQLILFKGDISHCSTTCTNSKGRWNIIINYL